MNEDGLTTIPSSCSVQETIDRLEQIAQTRGLSVFVRINHAADAAKAGLALRPCELLLFSHSRRGTPLMQDRPTAGIISIRGGQYLSHEKRGMARRLPIRV